MAEMLTYAPDLRSITQGQGDYTLEFLRYEEVPGHLAQKRRRGRRRRARGRARLSAPARAAVGDPPAARRRALAARDAPAYQLPWMAMTTRTIVTSQPDVACDVCAAPAAARRAAGLLHRRRPAPARSASSARRGPPTRAGCARRTQPQTVSAAADAPAPRAQPARPPDRAARGTAPRAARGAEPSAGERTTPTAGTRPGRGALRPLRGARRRRTAARGRRRGRGRRRATGEALGGEGLGSSRRGASRPSTRASTRAGWRASRARSGSRT